MLPRTTFGLSHLRNPFRGFLRRSLATLTAAAAIMVLGASAARAPMKELTPFNRGGSFTGSENGKSLVSLDQSNFKSWTVLIMTGTSPSPPPNAFVSSQKASTIGTCGFLSDCADPRVNSLESANFIETDGRFGLSNLIAGDGDWAIHQEVQYDTGNPSVAETSGIGTVSPRFPYPIGGIENQATSGLLPFRSAFSLTIPYAFTTADDNSNDGAGRNESPDPPILLIFGGALLLVGGLFRHRSKRRADRS